MDGINIWNRCTPGGWKCRKQLSVKDEEKWYDLERRKVDAKSAIS